ncbi:MAG TPA: GNAT family N-acetyltransferase [Acidimicrobiales bacterium]
MHHAFDTERMTLRPIRPDDVDEMLHLDADPEVMRYISGRPSTRDEVVAMIDRSLGERWVAHERATGKILGWFGLDSDEDQPGERELGYRLHRWAWGQGYATEGSRALIDLAFKELGVRRVWAQTMAVNTRSRRVMERCGLTYVRTFHLDWDEPLRGAEHGEVEYEILHPDPPQA